MVKLPIATGQLDASTQDYVFDYDNQFKHVGIYDSSRRYKNRGVIFKGFHFIIKKVIAKEHLTK